MYFWDRVVLLMEKENFSRKEVAIFCKFDVSLFSKGIGNNITPSAQIACNLARMLHTSVEYLVTGKEPYLADDENEFLNIYNKYSSIIKDLDELPEHQRKAFAGMISEMNASYKADIQDHKKLIEYELEQERKKNQSNE